MTGANTQRIFRREQFNTPIIIFLTVCTKARKPILINGSAHQLMREVWQAQPSWLVGRYVIMPDHIHLFCAPADLIPQPLTKWVNFWKSHAARHWIRSEDRPVWDTQLRRGESYNKKWDYVLENPVRAGLVKQSEDWPFQGKINVLEW